jgi:hypothetical protein
MYGMSRILRVGLSATLFLLVVLSVPLWLPSIRLPAQEPVVTQLDSLGFTTQSSPTPAAISGNGPVSAADLDLPQMTILDAGWLAGAGTNAWWLRPPAILRWDPTGDAIVWHREVGAMAELHADDNRLYLVEPDRLTILDAHSGEALSQAALKEAPSAGPNVRSPLPISRQGDRLYLRNNAWQGNLFYLNLETFRFGERTGNLCERGTPWDTKYLPQDDSFVTLCLDLSTGMNVALTRLSLADGSMNSVEMPTLGDEDYMVGNGLAVTPGGTAYVVDSDAGSVAEIDLDALHILRVAHYRPQPTQASWTKRGLVWLSNLAAQPAHAKRWMSRPAVSQDGRYLVVDGGFSFGGGETKTAWLLDLKSLEPVAEIKLPRSPNGFHFVGAHALLVVLQREMPDGAQAFVVDLNDLRGHTLDLPASGNVRQVFP